MDTVQRSAVSRDGGTFIFRRFVTPKDPFARYSVPPGTSRTGGWHRRASRRSRLEMRHRLRNAFTLSCGRMAEMSGRNTPEAYQGVCEGTVGPVYEIGELPRPRILEAVSGAERLPALITALVGVFDERAAVLKLGALPDLSVSEQSSRAVALALGELCTNSMKYGALRHDGAIDLRGENVSSTVMLRWSESLNVGTNVGAARTDRTIAGNRTGLALIRRMLVSMAADWTFDGRRPGWRSASFWTLPIERPLRNCNSMLHDRIESIAIGYRASDVSPTGAMDYLVQI